MTGIMTGRLVTDISSETKDVLRRFREESAARRALRAKVWRCYKDAVVREGMEPEAAKLRCMNRFGQSLVQVNNVLAHRVDLSPETVVDMDATVRVFVDRGRSGVESAWDEIDERLHELDVLEGEGQETVTVEVEETSGDKTFVKRKKQPIHEARLRLMERKLEVAGKFMDRLGAIAGRDAMAAAMGRGQVHIHVEADEQFKEQFNRIRGFGSEKVVDVDAVVADSDASSGE